MWTAANFIIEDGMQPYGRLISRVIKHSALHIDPLLLLAQTTHHGILGVGLYVSFCKIPHLGQFFKGDQLIYEYIRYLSYFEK